MKQWTAILGVCLIATVAAAVVTASADQTTKQDPNQAPATPETVKPAAPQPTSPPPPPPPPPPPRKQTNTMTATQGVQGVKPTASDPPGLEVPNPALQSPGRWLWNPAMEAWYWQPAAPPPVYYYVTPYTNLYPYWWYGPTYPQGSYRFIPNPNYRNTITGLLLSPPQVPSGQFKPGEGPQFPWNQTRSGSGFAPGVGAQGPWLPRERQERR
jgi:hypothetical protein